jgi:hypothetical protein
MSAEGQPSRPKARILGPGLSVTVEDADAGRRVRVRVRSRSGRVVELEPIPGAGITTHWKQGTAIRLRVARPFGLFRYSAEVEESQEDGRTRIRLSEDPPRRRQLRDFFRMPVRLAVQVERSDDPAGAAILRALDLSAGGVLLLDPERHISPGDQVRVGLPVGPSKGIVRLSCRVIRVQEDPPRVALAFEAIGETARQLLLRYLFREHRRRTRRAGRGTHRKPRVTPIREIRS